MAEELHHKMRHFEKEDIAQVLSGFVDVAARLMAEVWPVGPLPSRLGKADASIALLSLLLHL